MTTPPTITCLKFPAITIPAAHADAFCADRHQGAVHSSPCRNCDQGAQAVQKIMEATMTIKTCTDCGEEYKAASNVQKRCNECKKKRKAAAKPTKPEGAKTAKNCDIMQLDPTNYVIDLSNYPDLREQIEDAAWRNFRTPEMQILYILNQAAAPPEAVTNPSGVELTTGEVS